MRRGRVHISALLNNPIFYECGVATAMALCVMSVKIALQMHHNMGEMRRQGASRELLIATAIIVLHISFAPLILGTAVTVLDEHNYRHMMLTISMFVSSTLLVACYAIEAYYQGWVPGIMTMLALVLIGAAAAHVPLGVRQLNAVSSETYNAALAEVLTIVGLSMIYIDSVPHVIEKVMSS